jgi:hypothetical protein
MAGRFPTSTEQYVRQMEKRVSLLERRGGPGGAPYLPLMYGSNGTEMQTIVATSWANLPSPLTRTVELSAPWWCLITLRGWGSVVNTSTDLRVGTLCSGATSVAEAFPTWGSVAQMRSFTVSVQGNLLSEKMWLLQPGTTVVSARAYLALGASAAFNYARLEVSPVRPD